MESLPRRWLPCGCARRKNEGIILEQLVVVDAPGASMTNGAEDPTAVIRQGMLAVAANGYTLVETDLLPTQKPPVVRKRAVITLCSERGCLIDPR